MHTDRLGILAKGCAGMFASINYTFPANLKAINKLFAHVIVLLKRQDLNSGFKLSYFNYLQVWREGEKESETKLLFT